jgi:hypothetical protein
MDPSREEKLALMEWKFWIEGVLIPSFGIPGVCGRYIIVILSTYIYIYKINKMISSFKSIKRVE